MPIQVKDYVWEEAGESVLVTIPLKGVPPNRVDIFSIDDYIKVSISIAFEQALVTKYCIIDTVNGISPVGELPTIHF